MIKTPAHPILAMLGLSDDWQAHTRRAAGCSLAGCPLSSDEVEITGPRTFPFPFTLDGFAMIHSSWWEDSERRAELERTLTEFGIALVAMIGYDSCVQGQHKYWTWRRRGGAG